MFNIPAITWTLTTVLLLSGGYHLLQAARSRHLTGRINESLHALMSVLMAAMLWNLGQSTILVQVAVLTGAALWFVLQSLARPEFKILCASGQGRLKCVYHGLTMAGAALMLTMMAQMSTAGHGTTTAITMPASHAHHSAPVPAPSTTAPAGHSPDLAILLTAFFAVAAVVFLVLLLRSRPAATAARNRNHTAPKHSARAAHGHEVLGAAVMALMFATMSA